MRRQRLAVELVEQRGQADEITIHTLEQPIDRGIVDLQTAPLRAQTQHLGATVVVQWFQRDPRALGQPRTQIGQHQPQCIGRDPRCIQQAAAGVCGAVVGIEQRNFIVAAAGDHIQTVQRDHIGMFERIQRIAQATGRSGQRQVSGTPAGGFGFGAGGQQQMGLAGSGGPGDENTGDRTDDPTCMRASDRTTCIILAARQGMQLR